MCVNVTHSAMTESVAWYPVDINKESDKQN